jgi:predicted transcriptional regulator
MISRIWEELMSSSKGESVTTYVPSEIKRKLEAWAKDEQRSISFLVAQLITNAVNEREPKAKGDK